ncbi:putative Proton motive ATPase [Leptomonas seymouri]|uniref:Putative Proton motive ATPase n=1 Tax=Leptomonas seymouri TaxID=5684 RepID=A0A0N1I1X4_LEPSE|nr:putative Proton motive ATPase [Leptomonas seymouri]|eukprot:KPI84431.1 putative Proton motive ATPase [Leptomonas seymouri]
MDFSVGGCSPQGTEGSGAVRLRASPPLAPRAPTQPTRMPVTVPAPVALNSAALHTARHHFGINGIEVSTAGFFGCARCAVLSPPTLLVLSGLVLHLAVNADVGATFVFLSMLAALVVVVTQSAYISLRWATAMQRCFVRCSAVVYREGTWALVGSTQLVPGDLVQLTQGCVVYADCFLYQGSLLLDISQLTGSSDLMRAVPGYLLKAGTVVVDGSGCAVVRYTSSDTFIGQSVRLLEHLALGLTLPPVQYGYLLVSFSTLVVVVTMELVLYGLWRGRLRWSFTRVSYEVMLYAWVCLPLNLDVAVLQAVTRGASVAAWHTQAIVLRLGALLSLASMDTLVIDKSGTLTTGVYTVASTFRSFSPHYPSRDSLVQLMALAMKWRKPSSHPMRRAVLHCADLDACDRHLQLAYVEHEDEYRTSAILRQADGKLLRVTQGHLKSVLALLNTSCANHRNGGGAAAAASGQSAELLREWAEAQRLDTVWGYRGLRTQAVAVEEEIGEWRLAGLVTFEDTLRADAAELIRRCEDSGVSVTIASGDSKAVVATVAAALLPNRRSQQILIGADLPALEAWQALNASSAASMMPSCKSSLLMPTADVNADDQKAYAGCHVYAEMQPQNKVSLIRLLQRSGLRVGVFGDGINDAAAAHVADVGIALVTPERGPALTAFGAAWGADIALPSSRLTAACDLIAISRELFATVHSMFFHAFTAILQSAMLLGLAALMGPVQCHYDAGRTSCRSALAPSQLHLPFLVFLNVALLISQAWQTSDAGCWAAAPCHCSHPVAAMQSASMALVGVAGGAPFALGLPLAFLFRRCDSDDHHLTLLATTVTAYLSCLQLYLVLLCASPVRCGLRFLTSRAVYLACFSVSVGIMLKVAYSFCFRVQLALLLYCTVVSALQDAAKLGVHWVCYRRNFFGYRSCVDRMTGRHRRQREQQQLEAGDDGSGEGGEGEESRDGVPEDGFNGEPADTAVHRYLRPYVPMRGPVLGCLASLEMRLLRVAQSRPSGAAADEA